MAELNEEVRPTSASPPLAWNCSFLHVPSSSYSMDPFFGLWNHSFKTGLCLAAVAVAVCQVVPEFEVLGGQISVFSLGVCAVDWEW